MNLTVHNASPAIQRRRAMTLVEIMVALALGTLALAVVAQLTFLGARSFVSLGNYSALDQQSRLGIDQMTREIRQATALVGTNVSPKGLVFTNAYKGITVTYFWDPSTRELAAKYSNEADRRVLLRGCDSWNFSLWQRSPYPNLTNVFYQATSPAECKLVNMTWKCSRSISASKLLNTETIETAQIVLRNQKSY